jgi:tRNA-2-methylthio-N6-dimethylallyladenosine synthase
MMCTMHSKRVFVHTFGCQMNVYDSGRIAGSLAPLGYQPTDRLSNADLVVVNTCAIRDKAQQKVYSLLGRLSEHKHQRPEVIIAVGGCVAQQQGRALLDRFPAVDLVFGTRAVGRLPDLVRQVQQHGSRLVDTGERAAPEDRGRWRGEQAPLPGVSAFVTVMEGCDNHCTYCVVPYVRGAERSRLPEEILAEVQALIRRGVREVTLLGQNVNSYGLKEGLCSFAELLAQVSRVEEISRLRFTTSHPKDLSEQLMAAFRDLTALCAHIHLPVQSGSDAILRRMNRRYRRDDYLARVDRLRFYRPDIAITTDIIVGFPGESDEDFRQTLDLVSTVGFDSLFAFTYSDRPQAPAARLDGKLSEREKRDRLAALLQVQDAITLDKHRRLVGTCRQILVDGPSRRSLTSAGRSAPGQWSGRTGTNRIVHFDPAAVPSALPAPRPGQLIRVEIVEAFAHSLRGVPVATGGAAQGGKGDRRHAA